MHAVTTMQEMGHGEVDEEKINEGEQRSFIEFKHIMH
jgi:hypothetical protein